jgi:hypothetical protein
MRFDHRTDSGAVRLGSIYRAPEEVVTLPPDERKLRNRGRNGLRLAEAPKKI